MEFGDGDAALGSTDQVGDFRGDAVGQRNPAGVVPASDQALAPFFFDQVRDAARSGAGQRAEGVAVEVDDALGQDETIPEAGERVGLVPLFKRCA